MRTLRREVEKALETLLAGVLTDVDVHREAREPKEHDELFIAKSKARREWGGMGRGARPQKETVTVKFDVTCWREEQAVAEVRLEEIISAAEVAVIESDSLGLSPHVQSVLFREVESSNVEARGDTNATAYAAVEVEAECRLDLPV